MRSPGGRRLAPRPRPTAAALVAAARLVVLVAALVVVTASAASAHDSLERSDPPNGGMVPIGRTQLTLTFGEPVDRAGSSFSLHSTGPSAAAVPVTATLAEGGGVVSLATPPLERGTYTLVWAVAGEDGHPTSGTVIFGAGLRPAVVAAHTEESGASTSRVGLRFVDLAGLLLAIGALVVSPKVLTALGGTGSALRPRVLRLGAVGAGVSVVAACATAVLRVGQHLDVEGEPGAEWVGAAREILLGSTVGRLGLIRVAATAVAALALWHAGRGGRRPTSFAVAAAALVVAAGVDAWAGHASTLPARSTVAILAVTLHVLAAGIWAGGLLVALVGLRPLRRLEPAARHGLMLRAWRAYSPMAALAAGVLVATGLYEASRHLDSVATLSTTTYGTALVVKVLLLAVALGLAAHTTLVVNPALADRVLGNRVRWRPERHQLATRLTAEALALCLAVGVAALMTTVPTSRDLGRADAVTASAHSTVDGLFVTFQAVPTGSTQQLVVRAQPVLRPLQWPVTGVEVDITSRGASAPDAVVTLNESEAGRYEGTVRVPARSGDARVILHRGGHPDSVIRASWSPGSGNDPGVLELTASGVALLLLMAMASVLLLRLSRRPRPTTAPALVPNGATRPVAMTACDDSGMPRRPERRDIAESAGVRAGTDTLVRRSDRRSPS